MRTIIALVFTAWWAWLGWASTLAATSPATSPALGMIEVELNGQKIEGTPLAWDANVVHLLGRDGRLWSFKPNEAAAFRRTGAQFRPYSVSELRANLLRELGPDYEVSGTSHYMVAHPRGVKDPWADRFESLYRSFVDYFSVRGFKLVEPPFPLVGIVFRDRKAFEHYAAAQGAPTGAGVVGLYDLISNRILVYDLGEVAPANQRWRWNASTVVHEATHQMAFNTGVHNRYCPPPLWVMEGLATLFEAAGVNDAVHYPRLADRVNRDRLHDYQAALAGKHDGQLPAEVTASDRFFEISPMAAYAEAWAMTFYLVETQASQYARYLERTASHAPFSPYSSKERLADFTAIFGNNWPLFDAQFGRFMNGLK